MKRSTTDQKPDRCSFPVFKGFVLVLVQMKGLPSNMRTQVVYCNLKDNPGITLNGSVFVSSHEKNKCIHYCLNIF